MVSPSKFGIEVNFLTGRYVATAYNNRREGEWPPHPARLFSAMVDAWADQDERELLETRVLEWLEEQDPPAIAASEAAHRRVVSHFVPVNDVAVVSSALQERRYRDIQRLESELEQIIAASGEQSRRAQGIRTRLVKSRSVESQVTKVGTTPIYVALAMFPEPRVWHVPSDDEKKSQQKKPQQRVRQERFFPSVSPLVPRVTYLWDAVLSEERRKVLDNLLARVTRLGHSSSLVSCRLVDSLPEATLIPGSANGTNLRTVQPGQFKELERLFERHGGNGPRSLPFTVTSYSTGDESPNESGPLHRPNTAGEWLVFELEHGSRWLPVTRAPELASAMRDAVIWHADLPTPAEVSGIGPDGEPADMPHLAFLSMPFVGTSYADGRVMGVVLSIPDSVSEAGRQAIYRAVGTWERSDEDRRPSLQLDDGRVMLRLKRLQETPEAQTLQRHVWSCEARRWISASPIALPRHPGRLSGGTIAARAKAWRSAEEAVVASCEHVGLPAPVNMHLSLSPLIRGARHVRDCPPFQRKGQQGEVVRRQLVHAVLTFDEPVHGPLMLGAGRFAGLGLMRPIPELGKPMEGETHE